MDRRIIAVDWGTTNRRAWRMRGGGVEQEFADDLGFTSVAAGGFPAAVPDIRERLGDLPLLMAGMVGATRRLGRCALSPLPARPRRPSPPR